MWIENSRRLALYSITSSNISKRCRPCQQDSSAISKRAAEDSGLMLMKGGYQFHASRHHQNCSFCCQPEQNDVFNNNVKKLYCNLQLLQQLVMQPCFNKPKITILVLGLTITK